MEILDKHFMKLKPGKKTFLVSIGFAFLIIAIISYLFEVTNFIESFIILVIGLIYVELIKLEYRIKKLE